MDDGGLARLQSRLRAIPKDVREAAQASVIKQADVMAGTMRALVPVDDGDLKASIEVTPGGQSTPPYSQPGGATIVPELSVAITAGNEDVRYAHLVEHGTVKSPAQPFFWPAVRLTRKRVARNIKTAIGRAVKKKWGSS